MKVDGILFDLDGTLWDATQAIADSWAEVLKDQPDIPQPPTKEELESVMGMASEPLMAKLFPHITVERGRELFAQCCQVENLYLREHGGVLYPDIPEVMSTLSQRVPLFIVSNCNDGYIECFLDAHGLRSCFRDWECIGRTGKEKWENMKLVAMRNGLNAPVYVGDTVMDQASAQKAGISFIHAAYGFGQVPGVPKLSTPRDLLELID